MLNGFHSYCLARNVGKNRDTTFPNLSYKQSRQTESIKLPTSNFKTKTTKTKQPHHLKKKDTKKTPKKNSSFAKLEHQGTAFSIPLGVLASNSLLSGPSVSVPKFRRRRAARRSSTGEQRRGKQRMASLKKRSSEVHFLGLPGEIRGFFKEMKAWFVFPLQNPALQKVD